MEGWACVSMSFEEKGWEGKGKKRKRKGKERKGEGNVLRVYVAYMNLLYKSL